MKNKAKKLNHLFVFGCAMWFFCPVFGKGNTGQENNIAETKTDKWFSFSLHVSDRLVLFKCRFVASQRGLPRTFAGFLFCPNK